MGSKGFNIGQMNIISANSQMCWADYIGVQQPAITLVIEQSQHACLPPWRICQRTTVLTESTGHLTTSKRDTFGIIIVAMGDISD
ncbi:MAG: hypothetical protein EA401_09840 [Planctomycetota bacterium]|nr:MAG: hypothetical protein EA401_09840 [Planctomycetota bacterium]